MGLRVLAEDIDDVVEGFPKEFLDFVPFGLLEGMNEDELVAVEGAGFWFLNTEGGEVGVEFFAGDLQKFELVDLFVEFGDGLVFVFEGGELPLFLFEGVDDDVGIDLKGEKVAVNLFFELPVFIHRIHPISLTIIFFISQYYFILNSVKMRNLMNNQ